ncbi:hypothetical protein [Marinicella meishanensis]|uniref:hypothetical protein n=1 Tax=Marinicella meishanensis TaxID=2873263 RepID=UPI001CC0C738|nr:hypothetical protein [Marinicella sp. NBU2979]
MDGLPRKLNSWLGLSLLMACSASAVQVNPQGTGEVLIYPYYTVNNDLNTLYSVVNTTAETKAIKINFMESDIGINVLSFNVYLDGYDVWTGALISGTSYLAGHSGEPTAVHVSGDTSCVPYLVKAGQEFLSFGIDEDFDPNNNNMKRTTEGHIEVFEMATFTGQTVSWAKHGMNGVPANCSEIERDWSDNDIYDTADEAEPGGGLYGFATIVNVSQGLAFNYDAVALQNFWQGQGAHTAVGSQLPDLSAAYPESRVILPEGWVSVATWEHGFQAVSEVLTHAAVFNEYALNEAINAQTEWVLNFPTKKFHTATDPAVAPFSATWDGSQACQAFDYLLWDRASVQQHWPGCGSASCTQRSTWPEFCQSTQVIQWVKAGATVGIQSELLGSENWAIFLTNIGNQATTEDGFGRLVFPDTSPTTPLSGSGLAGLPVIGFAVQQFTNAAAAEGLLAQYGALFQHKYQVRLNPDP